MNLRIGSEPVNLSIAGNADEPDNAKTKETQIITAAKKFGLAKIDQSK